MSPQEFEQALHDAEVKLARLKALYEQWFQGIEKLEPSVARKELDRTFDVLKKNVPRNTALRFRMQQLVARYGTYGIYWGRVARQIEEGTFKRDVVRVTKKRTKVEQRQAEQAWELDVDVDEVEELDAEKTDPGIVVSATTREAAPAPATTPSRGNGGLAFDENDLDAILGALSTGPSPSEEPKAKARSLSPFAMGARPAGASATFGKPKEKAVSVPPLTAPVAAPPPATAKAPASPPAASATPTTGSMPRPAVPAATAPTTGSMPRPAPPAPAAPTTGSMPRPPVPASAAKPPPPGPVTGSMPRPPAPSPTAASMPKPAAPMPTTGSMPRPAPPAAAAPKPAAPVPAAAVPAAAVPAAPVAAPRPAPSGDMDEGRMRAIYDRYVDARRKNNERTDVRYEALAESVQKMMPKLREKHGGKAIDFDIVLQNGKVGLKPKVGG